MSYTAADFIIGPLIEGWYLKAIPGHHNRFTLIAWNGRHGGKSIKRKLQANISSDTDTLNAAVAAMASMIEDGKG